MSDALLGGQAIAHDAGEHTCRRVLIGEVDDVRQRLIRALERLDYRLLSEQQPLLARRDAPAGAGREHRPVRVRRTTSQAATRAARLS